MKFKVQFQKEENKIRKNYPFFIHIPKAGGNTMIMVFKRQYERYGGKIFFTHWGPKFNSARAIRIYIGDQRINSEGMGFPELLEDAATRFMKLDDQKKSCVCIFHGYHIEYGIHNYLSKPIAYFTLLRDPINRVLSHYYFTTNPNKWARGNKLYKDIASKIEPNLQAKILSGPHGLKRLPSSKEILRRAKNNLRSCTVVGLIESFDKTLILLKKAFNWKIPFYIRKNVHCHFGKEAISIDILNKIADDNWLDIQLYKYAKELFDRKIQQYGSLFKKDLHKFKVLNSKWQKLYYFKNFFINKFGEVLSLNLK